MNNFNNNPNSNLKPEFKINLNKYKSVFRVLGGLFIALILVIVFFNAFTFTVDEREQVIVKQFDKVVKVIVDEKTDEIVEDIQNQFEGAKVLDGKGLFFKIPFIQQTKAYTNKLLTYDTQAGEVTTKDKKKIVLDNFAQWKIYNPALFIATLGDVRSAHARIDDIIYSKINEEIGRVDAHELISNKDYVFEMLDRVKKDANDKLNIYGVSIIDIRIKKTDLPEENHENVFNRMRTERVKDANKYRSEGKEQAQIIRSDADRQATIIEAEAYEKAEKIKGEGDAEALKIYADAYNQDAEFYTFWRTLQAYKKTLGDKTKIVIDPDSDFAKYLFQSK